MNIKKFFLIQVFALLVLFLGVGVVRALPYGSGDYSGCNYNENCTPSTTTSPGTGTTKKKAAAPATTPGETPTESTEPDETVGPTSPIDETPDEPEDTATPGREGRNWWLIVIIVLSFLGGSGLFIWALRHGRSAPPTINSGGPLPYTPQPPAVPTPPVAPPVPPLPPPAPRNDEPGVRVNLANPRYIPPTPPPAPSPPAAPAPAAPPAATPPTPAAQQPGYTAGQVIWPQGEPASSSPQPPSFTNTPPPSS